MQEKGRYAAPGSEGSKGSEGSEGKVLKMDGPSAQGFLSLTGPLAPRVADCPSGNAYKVSVTDLPFFIIWHDKHSADWLAALASPYPAAPDFPLCRGQNKTPRNTLFINGSTVSTGNSAPACGGKVVAPATKGGISFARQGGWPVFPRPQGGCKGFIQTGAFYKFRGALHNPQRHSRCQT